MYMGNRTIVIIEDDDQLCKLYQIIFEAKGFTVHCYHNGLEGMMQLDKINPNILLVDLGVPEVSGKDIIKTVQDSETQNMPVVVVTGNDDPQLMQDMEQMGVAAYIVKGEYDNETFVNRIIEILNDHMSGE